MARLVHLTSVHDPFDTRIFFKQCQSLRAAGHEVVLVATHPQDAQVEGVRIRAVTPPRGRAERFLSTTRQVVRAALDERPDLVHLHDPELLPYAGVFRRRGIPVVFDMHENVPKALRTRDWIAAPLRPLVAGAYQALEKRLLKGVSVILAERSYARDYPWLAEPVTVLNLPLSAELVAMDPDPAPEPTIGYMGLVSRDRGSVTTARALGRLAEQGLEVNFECIGRIGADSRAALQEAIGSRAHIRGPMRPREGWDIIRRCHAGLALMRPIPNYLESFPTKLFEYMALGVPVICSDFPLYREVVEDAQCGICVDPEDVEAVANAMRWIIEHPDEARTMGMRGRDAVLRRYDWSGEAAKLLALYDRLLGRTSPTAS